MFKKESALSIGVMLLVPSLSFSKSNVLDYMKTGQPKGYQNQSQDRAIKKKSFKLQDIPNAVPVANKEIGLFATVTANQLKDDSVLKPLLSNPAVNGLSVVMPWQSIEPVEGKYQWADLDHVLALCADAKKTLILRISTCGITSSDTPSWVYDAGTKSVHYLKEDGTQGTMPIFWDSVYLAKWSNIINALGARFDANPSLHSIGVTGGGMLGGTQVVPNYGQKTDYRELEGDLTTHGMSQRQLVQHWKYVADLFPHAFPTARLNFDIDPPTPNRAGEDSLDEISDYLVYRYGERVYLTRFHVTSSKHGFDQYRIILKFKPDTLTGYQVPEKLDGKELDKLTKLALDDGTSYIELPADYFTETDAATQKVLEKLRSRLGYQLVCKNISIPASVKAGDKLKASFTFMNRGSAPAMRPVRQLDKDVASSYRIEVELLDDSGKPRVIIYHTPKIPTTKWSAGHPVTWEEELTMPVLKPGKYSVKVSLVDSETKRHLQFLDATTDKPIAEYAVAAGTVNITD